MGKHVAMRFDNKLIIMAYTFIICRATYVLQWSYSCYGIYGYGFPGLIKANVPWHYVTEIGSAVVFFSSSDHPRRRRLWVSVFLHVWGVISLHCKTRFWLFFVYIFWLQISGKWYFLRQDCLTVFLVRIRVLSQLFNILFVQFVILVKSVNILPVQFIILPVSLVIVFSFLFMIYDS